MSLSPEDLDRHRRHILLKEIGGPGVAKLRAASVSIIGAGALGGPAALYLAAAGIGQIELWDDDRVERSNLQRQIQFTESDTGAEKAVQLARRITALDPAIHVDIKNERFADGAAPSGNILIDATDNFQTRFLLNKFAHANGRYLVSGAASGWSGQVSVFASGLVAEAPCYACWIPEMPPAAEACDEVGVVGAITGMTGSTMALEAVKLITGAGEPLIGRILLIDGLRCQMRTVGLRRDSQCPVCSI
ncbi:putative molybdopterin biosynthesis protein MoeB [Hyphomonas polymorpha PS728]|uniref:Putative molybdopterin biosynthesis protein MoeB n=1 Tax=Hyphomonas polymorpha PS728 TaxID=1280954 RepID=A0A062VF59_9PROT|nr:MULTISPECIES: ThiF family adenylyltransferase [Hyphomonas]AXE66066.1 molybdopterin biosynthesis protein MoeB [Hyphomonas sp. CACIAM 19H1]KCZ97144.1 putative molybdopterin biosynthesis protein MoeB [Hyphomonas polymorpha PS728]